MAKARNIVLEGAYKNRKICKDVNGNPMIVTEEGFWQKRGISLGKANISAYELLTEEKIRSGTSTILRGAAGAAILGPVGLLAGLTGKKNGIYCVALQWRSGEKSLIEIDENLYKGLIRANF